MRWTVCALTLLLVVTATASAGAVGKITADPNTPGTKAATVAPEADARLDQKITYEARRKTTSAILQDLSTMTGVTLRAGYNNLDWQTRDRKMNIFANDLPLKSLMDSIARVMKFKWSKSDKDGTWTYRLYMDRKTLLGVERQALIEEERLAKLEVEQRARVLGDLTKAAAMSDAELENLKEADPLLYVEAKIGWSALMPDLFAQVPQAKQAWSAGDALVLNATDLPAEAQQALLKTLQVMGDGLRKVIGPDVAPPADIANRLSDVQISINYARSILGSRGDTYIGDVTLNWPGGGNQTAFVDPDGAVGKKIGRDYIRIMEGQPVGEQEQGEMNSQHLQAIEEQKTDFGEPLIEHPDDPALATKVKLKIKGERFEDLLAAVAKASGYAVVTDSFRTNYRWLDINKKEIPLKEVLDKIALACRYNWQRPDSTLEFRDRDWFRKRAAQIPESWLEPWRKCLDKTGTLDLDQLSQVASLDNEQLRENITPDDVLGGVGLPMLVFSCGDILRAYGCLAQDQRDAVFMDTGLDLSSILPMQWTALARIMRGDPDAAAKLLGKRERMDRQFKYTFNVVTSTQQPPFKRELTTPLYDIRNKINALPDTGAGTRALYTLAEARREKLSDISSWNKLALVLYDGNYYAQALEAFGHITESKKGDPMIRFAAYTWEGHLLDLMGRREDAIAAYKEALKIDIGGAGVGYDLYDIVVDKKWVEQRLKTPFER